MTDLYSLSLHDITPPNIDSDNNLHAIIDSIDPQLQQVSHSLLETLLFARIDELPDELLDLLAWQLHVDFYDLAGTRDMKLATVKGSLMWHMHKGTQWAIHEALRMIDIRAEFVPWWEDGSTPYTFKLRAIISGDYYREQGRDKLISSIRRVVDESKAARSLMAGLETRLEFRDDVALYAALADLRSGNVRISFMHPETPGSTALYSGLATFRQGFEVIHPHREFAFRFDSYAAPVMIENRDINLGVDYDLMQELLRMFEERIFARIDQYEQRVMLKLQENHDAETQRLDDIIDMLKWADPFAENYEGSN